MIKGTTTLHKNDPSNSIQSQPEMTIFAIFIRFQSLFVSQFKHYGQPKFENNCLIITFAYPRTHF